MLNLTETEVLDVTSLINSYAANWMMLKSALEEDNSEKIRIWSKAVVETQRDLSKLGFKLPNEIKS